MKWVFNDGGRAAAGYKGKAGDCVVRAIAIAARLPYQEVYDAVNAAGATETPTPLVAKRRRDKRSSARDGVFKPTIRQIMSQLGWQWTPTMGFGTGCTVHLRSHELPAGRLVVSVSKHLVAVIDGVAYDTHDCTRGGNRCVYGYWQEGVKK